MENEFRGPRTIDGEAGILILEETASTMEAARDFVRSGAGHGSAVMARHQSAGRGRFRDRGWEDGGGRDLLVTFIYEAARIGLAGFPLRVGLGLCRTVEELAGLQGADPSLRIKWPNDLLAGGRKLAGILCESSGPWLYAGIGVNCGERAFPPGLRTPATSLEAFLGRAADPGELFVQLRDQLEHALSRRDWRAGVEARLHLRGQRVVFIEGDPAGGRRLEGLLAGLGEGGELLLDVPGRGVIPCFSGELRLAQDAGPV